MYKTPIRTEDEGSDSKEEEGMDKQPRHSSRLNIRSTPTSPVHKKQRTLFLRGKKSKILLLSKSTSKTTSSTLKISLTSKKLAKFYNNV